MVIIPFPRAYLQLPHAVVDLYGAANSVKVIHTTEQEVDSPRGLSRGIPRNLWLRLRTCVMRTRVS